MNTIKLLIITIFSLFLYSQEYTLDNWNLYTSYIETNEGVVDKNGDVWVASRGGVFKYSPSDSSFLALNFVNNLEGINYKAIEYIEQFDIVVAGSNDGVISIIYNDLSIVNVSDIKNSEDQNKTINDLLYSDGILYVAYGSGLAELNLKPGRPAIEQTIGDALKIGNVNKVKFFQDKIWICTSNAEILSIEKNRIITDLNNWDSIVLNAADGDILDLEYYDNKLIVGTNTVIYSYENEDFDPVLQIEPEWVSFQEFMSNDNELFLCQSHGLERYSDNLRTFSFGNGIFTSGLFLDDKPYLFATDGGLFDLENQIPLFPNGLSSNIVFDIQISSDNEIWVTSSVNGTSRFASNSWTTYNDIVDIHGNDYTGINNHLAIELNDNKDVFIGIKGPGQLYMEHLGKGEYQYRMFNDTNSTFIGVVELPEDYKPGDEVGLFTEAGDTKIDRNGVVWSVCAGDQTDGNALVANNNGLFYSFAETNNCTYLNNRTFYHLFIDDFGTKWLGSDRAASTDGLVLFNENGTLDDPSDDFCINLRTRDIPELPSNNIKCITSDLNGWVWVGTNRGLAYFLNPSGILPGRSLNSDPDNLIAIEGTEFLNDLTVNDIFVDPQNRKWLATNKGIQVVDEEATEILQIINSSNSPIGDDQINSIEFLSSTGELLIGTNIGLYRVQTEFIQANENFNFEIYPQPFNLNKDSELVIDGLAQNSEVRIISTTGEEVFFDKALGKTYRWNGRSMTGSKVKSGVYYIIGTSETTSANGVAKFAIINK